VNGVDGEVHFESDLAFGITGKKEIEGLAEARGEGGGAAEAVGGFFSAVHPLEAGVEGIDERPIAGCEAGRVAPATQGTEGEGVTSIGTAVDGKEAVVGVSGATEFLDMGGFVPGVVINEVGAEGCEALGAGFEETVDATAGEGIAEGGGVEFVEEGLAVRFDLEADIEEGDHERGRVGGEVFQDEGGADGGGEELVESGEKREAPTSRVITVAGEFTHQTQQLRDIGKIEAIGALGVDGT